MNKLSRMRMTMGAVGIFLTAVLIWTAGAGDLDPPGPPAPTMKTLDEVEPRTAIHQWDIPLVITESGSYYLAENVSHSGGGGCISVNADDVTIDLSGFTMEGVGTAYYGIYMSSRDNVEIRNGVIRGFRSGIIEASLGGQNHRIFNVRLLSCTSQGISMQSCDNCQVRDCTIADGCTNTDATGSGYGIYVGSNCIVTGNTIYHNGTSTTLSFYGITTSSGSVVKENAVYGNGDLSTGSTVCGIWAGSCSTVSHNTIYDNGSSFSVNVYGIHVGSGSIAAGNAVYNNGDLSAGTVRGIDADSGCTLTGNTSYSNGSAAGGSVYGIDAYVGCIVDGNIAYSNGISATGVSVYGIYVSSGATVTGNASRGNGGSASGTVYGIYLGGYNLVNNNTAYSNNGTNMNAPGTCIFGVNCAP